MSAGWANSDRRLRLPGDWRHRRERTLARHPYCRCIDFDCPGHRGRPCLARSTEVDHVRAGDDHSDYNLQGLCSPCHKRKTIRERPASQRRRPPEAHPGLT